MSNEPKPCPFCGNPEINPEGWRDNSGRFGPECFDCGLLQLDAWNHRPLEEELRAKLEMSEGLNEMQNKLNNELVFKMEVLHAKLGKARALEDYHEQKGPNE